MKKDILKVVIALVFFVAAIFTKNYSVNIALYLFIVSYITVGAEPVITMFKSFRHGSFFGEDTLMVVASIGAFFMKEYSEAVAVMIFYSIGEIFEDYAVGKSRKSITDLMNICPTFANLIKDGKTVKVKPDELKINDKIIVAPGEKVPVDGIVIKGRSLVDTSALTGEAVPKTLQTGDEILSGFINTNDTLTVEVTKLFEDSTVSKVLELVEDSAAKKSNSEKFITKFAKYYTPIVIGCAAALVIIPLILHFALPIIGINIQIWVYKALEFLVVSCPCALVISVPISFFGGIGAGAKRGILIKGGNYLESIASTENAVFDKTGTLTKGIFEVTEINCKNIDKTELLYYAALAENQSTHPIAKAILSANKKEIDISAITSSHEEPGLGVSAVFDNKEIKAGNLKMMQKYNIRCDETGTGSVVYVAVNNEFAGSIVISDEIKPSAENLMNTLKSAGIKNTCMLTGDNEKTAAAIGSKLKIDKIFSNLLPGDKVGKLEEIMKSGGKTLYVGDGINDAPVIARADIGIAMGALGSDAAIEAADIVIMNDDISKVADAVKIGRHTRKIAKENIVFALTVKILILLLCAVGITNMWAAVFGDVGVLVLCVLNSFRALNYKKD